MNLWLSETLKEVDESFFDHRVLRTTTKRRIFKRIKENLPKETINSYLGWLKWSHTYKLRNKILNSNKQSVIM